MARRLFRRGGEPNQWRRDHQSGGPWNLAQLGQRQYMVGALDANTLIYSKGDGIYRSEDTGSTWAKVSDVNPQTRIPVLFRGAHYLGTTNGLLASKDLGASWQQQGARVRIWQGPFFG